MKFSFDAALAILALASSASAETMIGAFIFGRHGDRLAKPTTILTSLGAHQLSNSGKFYHDRYIDPTSPFYISGLNVTYHESQFTAQAPNSDVIQMSQYAFFQGLYPPLESLPQNMIQTAEKEATPLSLSLANGSSLVGPLDGYQYVVAQGVDDDAPDSIWIKGDQFCPAYTNASNAYFNSQEFLSLNQSTLEFYQGLSAIVGKGIPKSKLNYGNAYSVFDYINVNRIHNGTFAKLIDQNTFNQVQWLQDQYTTRLNYNASNAATTIGGQTLLAGMYSHLNQTLVQKTPLLTLFTGSYDAFSQFFGLAGLIDLDPVQFTGIVNYGASMVLELYTPDASSDVHVRFLFRNGTETTNLLTGYPIFGQDVSGFKFSDFATIVAQKSIPSLQKWCNSCSAWDLDMCAVYEPTFVAFQKLVETKGDAATLASLQKALKEENSSLSLAAAGGIGAGVTIGVGLIALLLFLGVRKMMGTKKRSEPVLPVKEVIHGTSSIDSVTTAARH